MRAINLFIHLSLLGIILILTVYFVRNKNPQLSPENKKSISKTCILPPHLSSGLWSIRHPTSNVTSVAVPAGTILEISCMDSHKLEGSKISICSSGNWFPKIGRCLRTCPTLRSTSVLKMTCIYDNQELTDCTNPVEGTYAQFNCGPYYRDIRKNRRMFFCNENGEWSDKLVACVPVCGQTGAVPLVIRGGISEIGAFPWQVAIYLSENDKKRFICGGSLISENIVLTAAHCFFNEKGELDNSQNFRVVAGNHYQNFNDTRDELSQKTEVLDVSIHMDYTGLNSHYSNDIALITTKEPFTFNSRIQLICIDWQHLHKEEILNPEMSKTAEVAGWGYTRESGNASEVLMNLTVPIVGREKCRRDLPKYFLSYLTKDKLCAGYVNKSTSLCRGDSGGGLVVNLEKTKYVIGVVSVGPGNDEGGCDSNQTTLYTNVYFHIDEFLLPKFAGFKIERKKIDQAVKPSENDCIVPYYPTDGTLLPMNEPISDNRPGERVSSGTIFKLECLKGYKLEGNSTIVCINGTWTSHFGRCLKTCPPIHNTTTLNITCRNFYTKMESCVEAVDGTIAKYHCASFYESNVRENFPLFCSNGSWSMGVPDCVPICGKIDDQTTHQQYPWDVSIYNKDKKFLCSGTLLNEKFIVTAAHCVTDKGINQPIADLSAAVRKYHQVYDDPRDLKLAQFSVVDEIFIPKNYKKYHISNYIHYFEDIALLVTKTAFNLSNYVQPVCIDWHNEYKSLFLYQNINFSISGWSYCANNTSSEISFLCGNKCDVDLVKKLNEDKLCLKGKYGDHEGGGLVFKREGSYYLAGVFSSTQERDNLFTEIYFYIDKLLSKMSTK